MSGFEVGQRLFLVFNRYPCKLGYAVITKVGRVYLTVEKEDARREFKVNKETLCLDGGKTGYGSIGNAYLTEKEYRDIQLKSRLWNTLTRHMRGAYSPPKEMTIEKLVAALDILGIAYDKEGAGHNE